jgi:hypothetical protein
MTQRCTTQPFSLSSKVPCIPSHTSPFRLQPRRDSRHWLFSGTHHREVDDNASVLNVGAYFSHRSQILGLRASDAEPDMWCAKLTIKESCTARSSLQQLTDCSSGHPRGTLLCLWKVYLFDRLLCNKTLLVRPQTLSAKQYGV